MFKKLCKKKNNLGQRNNTFWKNKKWMNVHEPPSIKGRKTLLTFNPFLNEFTSFMLPILNKFLISTYFYLN
jgi:hypothetical protein